MVVGFVTNFIPQIGLLGTIILVFAITVAIASLIPALRRHATPIESWVSANARVLAIVVALAATIASLFYSEIAGYTPCKLCWYQRIFMYPQVFLFGTAFLARTRDVFKYSLVLSLTGLAISIYHYIVQVFQITTNCVAPGGAELEAASCSMRFVFDYGFISIPFMAGVAFALIALISIAALRRKA